MRGGRLIRVTLALTMASLAPGAVQAQRTAKPVLHGRHWVAITGKPLAVWTQGPVLLQALNILGNVDLAAMGYNSARYIHTLYQAMNLAFTDRDFYYGDPDFPLELRAMGYDLDIVNVNSGPINAIFFDRAHGTMWGGSAIQGDDYGIAW